MHNTKKYNSNSKDSDSSSEFASIRSVKCVDYEPPETKLPATPFNVSFHPSIWFALAIMSIVGIVAVTLHFIGNQEEERINTLAIKLPEERPVKKEEVLTPEQKAVKKKNSVFENDIDQIAKNCARMVNGKNSFAVFEHGTCVLLIEPIEDPVLSAKSSLKILSDPKIEFEVQALDNNNYLIIFNKYLFCWMFADQLAKNKDAIMHDRRLERIQTDSPKVRSLSDMDIRVGKLARLCLLEDSRKLNIKKIIRAKAATSKKRLIK